MIILAIILGIVLGICVISLSILLYNHLLLISEMNKRLISVISDILGSINLETPQIDLITNNQSTTQNVDSILNEATQADENYFNPHEFDVEQYKEQEDNL